MKAATEPVTHPAVRRVIGLDPGLRNTGWGVIEVQGNHLRHIANGTIHSNAQDDLAVRLRQLFEGLCAVITRWQPAAAAVETTFVNKDAIATLKLGQARGVVMLAPASLGLPVAEYAPNQIKKSLAGAGHADKAQIRAMVGRLLPGCEVGGADAADALAIAICHAHFDQSARLIASATARSAMLAGAR